MTKRQTSGDVGFSAVDIVNRQVEKELEGYSRAFAVYERLRPRLSQGSKCDSIGTRDAQEDDGE